MITIMDDPWNLNSIIIINEDLKRKMSLYLSLASNRQETIKELKEVFGIE